MLIHSWLIEFAGLDDVASMARLSRDEIERGLGWKYTAPVLARLLRDRSKNVVVARVDGELAGFGVMTYRNHQANLDLLAVRARYRRRRAGRQLVAWLCRVALTAGIASVFVQVRESNHIALAFYRALGFQRIDLLRGYYHGVENAVVLVRPLRPLVSRSGVTGL